LEAHRHFDPQCFRGCPKKSILEYVDLIETVLRLGELEYVPPTLEDVSRS